MADSDKYLGILKEYWGYPDFRGIQRDIIESIGRGEDTLGLMPTGGGKSLTFQVPALAQEGVCIVITPLIALMKDQVDHLRKKGILAYAIYGSMQHQEILQVLENAVLGGVKLLYISPERLSSELFQQKLRHMKVSFITVDEAHCICQWGYDFRPSYLTIKEIRKIKPDAPILALTATATPETESDIQKQLGFKQLNVKRMSFKRSNLAYIVRYASDKMEQAVHILKSVGGSAIVYVYSRKKTKEVADALNECGISATFYHAGLDHTLRDERQTQWQDDKVKVMVATNAFGMGIDKPDVRLVIHIDCPDSIEAYFQEAGRAGRDGQKAYAVLLYNSADKVVLGRRIADNFPDKDYIKQVYEHIAYFFQLGVGSGQGYSFDFNSEKFCIYFKHFPTRMQSALKILERAGYIEYNEDNDDKARLRFIVGRNDLYKLREQSDKENSLIIAALRTYSGMFSDYAFINLNTLSKESGLTEDEVYDTLKLLNRKRIVEFIPQKDTPRIKYIQDRVKTSEIRISKDIYDIRKERFTDRILSMLTYADNDNACRSRLLLDYFAEKKSDDCGQCDVCLTRNRDRKAEKLKKDKIRKAILELLSDGKPHNITELYTIEEEDTTLIDETLSMMASEEEIFNDDGKICL